MFRCSTTIIARTKNFAFNQGTKEQYKLSVYKKNALEYGLHLQNRMTYKINEQSKSVLSINRNYTLGITPIKQKKYFLRNKKNENNKFKKIPRSKVQYHIRRKITIRLQVA